MKIYKSNYVWKSANPDHTVMGNPAKSRNRSPYATYYVFIRSAPRAAVLSRPARPNRACSVLLNITPAVPGGGEADDPLSEANDVDGLVRACI
jgi:hypothetical protein